MSEVDDQYEIHKDTPLMQKAVFAAAAACYSDMQGVNKLMALLDAFALSERTRLIGIVNVEATDEAERIIRGEGNA